MIVTEKQARKIQCPHGRIVTYEGSHFFDQCCIASDCMAWRWWKLDKKHGYCGFAGVPHNINMEPEPEEEKKK